MTAIPSANKVIVAGCQHGGLAVIRTLGKQGIPIIAISYKETDFGLASRYVVERAISPHPKDTRAFADFLLERAADWEGSLILEAEDYYAAALSAHKAELCQKYRMITPDWNITQIFLEKDRTYALADECHVPHPALFQPKTMADLEEIIPKTAFPIMIKPVLSHEFVNQFDTKLFIIQNVDELRRRFGQTVEHNLNVMIQEIIPGTDERALESVEIYVNSAGQIAAEQFNVKLRQTPPMFGVMRAGETVPPINDIREYAHTMLQHIDYRGFASFEFKRDGRDGLPKLIEVNIRQPRNGQLLIASGTDIPWVIYQDLMLNKQESKLDYNHVYFIDMIPDVGNTLFREPHILLNLPKFLKPYFSRHKTFAVYSASDTKPFVRLLTAKWTKIGRLTRKLFHRNHKSGVLADTYKSV